MSLIRLENATLSFGAIPLLDKVNLQIEHGEKIFLIGRNGMGKSSLLKVITGHYALDAGTIEIEPTLKIAELSQDLPTCENSSVYEYVALGLQELGDLLKKYHNLTSSEIINHDEAWLEEMGETQKKLDQLNGWQYEKNIEIVLTRLELNADQKIGDLSGGWKRRASLAKALVAQPDLLVLDEPTNHLDVAAIEWLEDFLAKYSGTLLCITHDRTLLQKLSKRILELDRGHIISWQGDFKSFITNKEHRLEVESKQNYEFDKKLAKEEAWIRQGIKARRTRNEGRARALDKLREKRSQRRELQGKPKFNANEGSISGDLVIKAKNISFNYNNNKLIHDFTIEIHKGDKIALIGPNGVGKSTLLKLFLGQLTPSSGSIQIGTNLKIAYFDQMRASIDYTESAITNVGGGRDFVTINGKEKHVISYLSDFLFSPDRVRIPVKMLSGGECNRLLLAKLFSLPSNLLILDEPTNDLDIESLELLEEILLDYKGTILLVSHDRTFVDQVATSTIVFRGEGIVDEYVGSFKDIPIINKKDKKEDKVTSNSKIEKDNKTIQSSKIKKELHEIMATIDKLEKEHKTLLQEISDNSFYNNAKEYQTATLEKLNNLNFKLESLNKRWEELEDV